MNDCDMSNNVHIPNLKSLSPNDFTNLIKFGQYLASAEKIECNRITQFGGEKIFFESIFHTSTAFNDSNLWNINHNVIDLV